ncbi:MAG: helix-turn-helix transcriptional regulator [Acidimicrobiales bacterium]
MDHDIEHEADAAGPVAAPGFLEACIMLALDAKPTYGYQLKGELDDLGFHFIDRGRIYRALRAMEAAGQVRSRWDTTSRGPARRIYDLEPPGQEALRAQVLAVRRQRRQLSRFLGRYERAALARSKAVA